MNTPRASGSRSNSNYRAPLVQAKSAILIKATTDSSLPVVTSKTSMSNSIMIMSSSSEPVIQIIPKSIETFEINNLHTKSLHLQLCHSTIISNFSLNHKALLITASKWTRSFAMRVLPARNNPRTLKCMVSTFPFLIKERNSFEQ